MRDFSGFVHTTPRVLANARTFSAKRKIPTMGPRVRKGAVQIVIPEFAQANIRDPEPSYSWVPACAGMTMKESKTEEASPAFSPQSVIPAQAGIFCTIWQLDARLRGHDGEKPRVPAKAGTFSAKGKVRAVAPRVRKGAVQIVIPEFAQANIRDPEPSYSWVPACAGMTMKESKTEEASPAFSPHSVIPAQAGIFCTIWQLDARLRGHDGEKPRVPAKAGTFSAKGKVRAVAPRVRKGAVQIVIPEFAQANIRDPEPSCPWVPACAGMTVSTRRRGAVD